jgi:hypothetical protein
MPDAITAHGGEGGTMIRDRWKISIVSPGQPEKAERFKDEQAIAVVLLVELHLPYLDKNQGDHLSGAVRAASHDKLSDSIVIDDEKIEVSPEGDGVLILYSGRRVAMDASEANTFASKLTNIANRLHRRQAVRDLPHCKG